MYLRTLRNTITLFISIATFMVAMSFKGPPSGKSKLSIRFENYVADKKLSLDTVTYTNALGQQFTVSNFKFYISDIELHRENSKTTLLTTDCFLIKQDDEGSFIAELNDLPEGDYSSITFTIGVDSLRNCSGAQSGALDPINGMFWTWSTGYIFMKLEGKSPSSIAPGHTFEYHIGGYKEPTNFIRNSTLEFTNQHLRLIPNKTTTLYVKTDIAKVLDGAKRIDFSLLPSITDFHHADEIAANYVNMFSIIRMSNEW